jgi:hypothetical protein
MYLAVLHWLVRQRHNHKLYDSRQWSYLDYNRCHHRVLYKTAPLLEEAIAQGKVVGQGSRAR